MPSIPNPFANIITLTSTAGIHHVEFKWTQATKWSAYKCEVRIDGSEWVRRPSFDATDATIGDMLRAAMY